MDDAVRIYQDMLAKSPDYLQGRYRLGEILLIQRRHARRQCKSKKRFKKDSTIVRRSAARSHACQSGQPDGLKSALEDLSDVLRQEPNSRPALYIHGPVQFQPWPVRSVACFCG
jgi:hypothetical protein